MLLQSKVVSAVAGSPPVRISTKQNTFRFLVPIDKLMANPITGPFFGKLGFDCQHVFTTRDRRMVVYPCRNAKLLNIVAMHPAEDAGLDSESSWLAGGRVQDLLDVYKEFGPELIEMCRIGEDLKLWSLATRDPPTKFYKGRTVLLGDAAHPMLPRAFNNAIRHEEELTVIQTKGKVERNRSRMPQLWECCSLLTRHWTMYLSDWNFTTSSAIQDL